MKYFSMARNYILIAMTSMVVGFLGCGGANGPLADGGAVTSTQNPLVAEYDVVARPTGAAVWVEFGTDTTYGRQTSSVASTSTYQTVKVDVAGMLPNTLYHMRAHVDWNGGSWVDQDRTFTTGNLTFAGNKLIPPTLVVKQSSSLKPQPGVELFSCLSNGPNDISSFVTDLQGNIIWYIYGGALPLKPMPNGDFIGNAGGALQEFDLAGNIVRSVSVQQVNQSLQAGGYPFSITDFHHDQLALQNGHWIGLANTLKSFTDLPGYPGVTTVVGDVLLDIDPSGNVVWAWNGFDHLDINYHPWGFPPALAPNAGDADWTHGNALDYAADGNLIFSMRQMDWVIKIDYQNGTGSGDILWHLGNAGDFTLEQADPSLWFYGQHNVRIVSSNGSQTTLSIWDNGNLRENDPGCTSTAGCYSRATLFQVDESTKVANLLFADSPGLFSPWGGAIEGLANGNVEFDANAAFGTTAESQVMEVTQTATPQTVWQLNIIGEDAYRAYRIPSLYPGVTWTK